MSGTRETRQEGSHFLPETLFPSNRQPPPLLAPPRRSFQLPVCETPGRGLSERLLPRPAAPSSASRRALGRSGYRARDSGVGGGGVAEEGAGGRWSAQGSASARRWRGAEGGGPAPARPWPPRALTRRRRGARPACAPSVRSAPGPFLRALECSPARAPRVPAPVTLRQREQWLEKNVAICRRGCDLSLSLALCKLFFSPSFRGWYSVTFFFFYADNPLGSLLNKYDCFVGNVIIFEGKRGEK